MTQSYGYLHNSYAESLSEFGTPVKLQNSDGWILKRLIPGYIYYDGMGCYPIFTCKNWNKLDKDLNELNNELICLSIVTDPFGGFNINELKSLFDNVVSFKDHYIINLKNIRISAHHKRNITKALTNVSVEKCNQPFDHLDDWLDLYKNLIKRHNIKGITAFSKKSFVKQFQVPGLDIFRAIYKNKTVGILLWYANEESAYYHLGAYSETGYEMKASYALFASAIDYYKSKGLKWLSLGAGAGVNTINKDGLTRFKQGWSTETRTVYFCSKIFNNNIYSMIVNEKGLSDISYFPAYRYGEFS